jgi:hypothetical protein
VRPPPIIARRRLGALLLPGLLGLLLAAVLLVLHQFDPAHNGFYPGCTFHQLTGLNCPGCGGLRATHQLLHGHVLTAFHHNALVVLGVPMAVGWGGLWLWRRARRIPPRLHGFSTVWLWVLFGGMVLFTVLRNLPLPFFAGLSP